jgi:hypothetical protein
MRYTGWPLALLLLAGCAAFAQGDSTEMERGETWSLAHQALAVEDFDRASALFERLATSHAGSDEGREAVFYLGAIRLDPRNPDWDPKPAEEYLRQYLTADSVPERMVAPRRPEAQTLLELAAQLNMPPSERVPGLQAETQVVVEAAPQRVVVTAAESRALSAEVARLRRELAARDATIQTQRDEIERIRKTLTGRDGG